jgi:hypothetical protein
MCKAVLKLDRFRSARPVMLSAALQLSGGVRPEGHLPPCRDHRSSGGDVTIASVGLRDPADRVVVPVAPRFLNVQRMCLSALFTVVTIPLR